MKILSFSFVISIVFAGYVINTIWTLAEMFIPPACKKGDQCLQSYFVNNPKQKLLFFSSYSSSPAQQHDTVEKVHEIYDFQYEFPFSNEINLSIPRKTRKNGTLFLHITMIDADKTQVEWKNIQYSEPMETIPLTVYAVPQAATFNLINTQGTNAQDNSKKKSSISRPVTHLKSRVTFSILTDRTVIPVNKIPNELYHLIRISKGNKYKPILQYNLLKTRIKELIEVTPKSSNITLTVDYLPISFGKLRLLQHLKIALKTLNQMGFSEKELDDVKGIFADTNLYLLCATTFIASFHLLFDFLAFKNDVSFWHKKRSMVGLSMRTVLWRAFSQTIIMLYLFDENTSLIVLVPAGIGTLIEMWKVNKVLKVDIRWVGYLPSIVLRKDLYSEAEMKTHAVDAEAMKYLSYLLYPLCIGGAAYSLIYEPHKSWYSWSLHSLVNGVYAFGFLFMLPQLFVNYKLKSVAALPWRAFMYKAFNTFIDDIFAFIITMPTAHRVACFRDDIVFLVYLYQRWLYPVDKSRNDEATSMDEPQETIQEKKDK